MRLITRALLLSCMAAAATSSAVAGSVNVSFIDAPGFFDAGTTRQDKDANLQALAEHLQALGRRYLPAEQTLKVEVLDVDLVGTVRPSRRSGLEIRIVNNGADWPRIKLRYTLESNAKALSSGEEMLADLNYAHGLASVRSSAPLYYEKHMLEEWFKARFVEHRAAGG